MTRRSVCLLAATTVLWFGINPVAAAVDPPVANPAALPADQAPRPVEPMTQRYLCAISGTISGPPADGNANRSALNLDQAWKFSMGEGQTVAVIDTGVQPGPRLPNLDNGGDYVEGKSGLTDCDGHGTLVAGIIAAQPGPDGFVGVARAARIISIRETSAMFGPKVPSGDPMTAKISEDVQAMARAIVHAANLGARVINISVADCLPIIRKVDQDALGAAVRYAAVDKDAVIVAAAGDMGNDCTDNPPVDLSHPSDIRNWQAVSSISIPSWWQPYVLSVASLTALGQPSGFTMPGPWVGIGAVGENIVSLSNGPGGGLSNGLPDSKGQQVPINGTGYAAAYVSGVVALVRSKYPTLSAHQIVNRIIQTAHNSARSQSNLVGAGTIDPVAALTWDLPAGDRQAVGAAVKELPAPVVPAPPESTARDIAFTGVGLLILVVGSAAAICGARRRKDAIG